MFKFFKKSHRLILLSLSIGIIVGLIPSLYFNSQSKKIEEEKISLERKIQELEDEAFFCEDLKPSLEEIMEALPEKAKYYKIFFNGMSPGCSYYSLGIYYGGGGSEDKPEIDPSCTTNEIVGAWVVNTKTKEAKRIASCRYNEGKYHESNFSRWITDNLVELRTDDHDYARVIDVTSGKTVLRRITRVNLHLPDIRELSEVQFIPLDEPFPGCQKEGYMSYPFIQYDFDCLRRTDVEVHIKGETKLLMKYIDEETIEVSGVVYSNLLDYQNSDINISY